MLSYMENVPEPVEDGVNAPRRDFGQLLSAFLEESDSYLDGIVGGRLKEEGEDLQGQDLVCHLLVDQVSHEPRRRDASGLVVPLEPPLEVDNQPLEQKLPDVGELGIDDRHQGGVHVGECRRRNLGLQIKDEFDFSDNWNT